MRKPSMRRPRGGVGISARRGAGGPVMYDACGSCVGKRIAEGLEGDTGLPLSFLFRMRVGIKSIVALRGTEMVTPRARACLVSKVGIQNRVGLTCTLVLAYDVYLRVFSVSSATFSKRCRWHYMES